MAIDMVPRFATAYRSPRPRTIADGTTWSGPGDLVLVGAGAAIGFGDFWTFPSLVARHGGGAFLLLYLACMALLGLPLLVAELSLGASWRSPMGAATPLRPWAVAIAWIGGIGGLLTLATYVVAAGWALGGAGWAVVAETMGGGAGITARRFSDLVANPLRLIPLQTAFLALAALIVAQGIRPGLERTARLAVPLLLAALTVAVLWQAATASGHLESVLSRLRPDFSRLGPDALIHAASQAFFTLSLATGAVFVAGRCSPAGTDLRRAAGAIVALDTLAAILATLLILPSFPAPPGMVSEGPALLFVSLPAWLGHQPGGPTACTFLCVVLFLAALSSATMMIEPAVAWVAHRTRLGRGGAVVVVGVLVWAVALVGTLSFSAWREIRVAGAPLFDGLSFLGANFLLPLAGLGVALLAGWTPVLEGTVPAGTGRSLLRWLLRYVIPVAMIAILVAGITSW
jgi:neurotransmitter:Na+ symporter, NSS family